jgi:peptide/nickel transport system permease protein
MIRFIVNRLLYLIPVLFIMSVIVFSFMHLIPGDPVDYILGVEATPETKATLRAELGLDKNIVVQYLNWSGKILTGDFGKSTVNKRPVLKSILEKLPATLVLSAFATIISTVIALFLGTLAAQKRGSLTDIFALILALLWVSIPWFWLGILLILLFSIQFPILPSLGYASIFTDLINGLRYLILPALTLGGILAGAFTRMTRSEMIEQLNQDYITTAWAKGLPKRVIIYKHALKNAMIPVITFIGLQLGSLLGGAVVVEKIFAWPGVGRLVVESIFARDYPMVQGIVMFLSLIFVFINLLVDISYTFLDPRIRMGDNG